MTRRSTKSALLSSVLALFLCITMLMGTTFAWFTDSVTSANNIIKSGNLDITLEYWNGTEWKDVQGSSEILDKDALWEPGYTDIAYLRMKNAGSLALKYQLSVNIVSEKAGVNQAGDPFKLSDYIYYDVVEGVDGATAAFANREAAMAETTETNLISVDYKKNGTLAAESAYVYLAMIVYMPTTVGNVANHNGKDVPQIDLGINLLATQMAAEKDSFDENYDAGSPWLGAADINWYVNDPTATEFVLHSAEELVGLAAIVNGTATTGAVTYAANNAPTVIKDDFAGQTIKLDGNIDLNNVQWTPIGTASTPFKGTFDGQGHIVSNLYINAIEDSYQGLFGYVSSSAAMIKGVTVHNVNITGYSYVGSIVGRVYTGSISDCHVTGSVQLLSDYAYAGGIVGGDYVNITDCSVIAEGMGKIKINEKTGAGGICGWHTEGNYLMSNCHVKNLDITAYANIGGITGFVHYENTIDGCSVENVNLTKFRVDGNPSIGLAAGGWSYNANKAITITNNSFKDITLNGTYVAITSADILFGSEYSANLNQNFVLDNNTKENITNNLVEVTKIADGLVQKQDGSYEIYNEAGLQALGGTKINGTYKLVADLNMTDKDMKSMEVSAGATVNFIGNNHSISNLNLTAAKLHGMTGAGNEVAGLFDLTAPATAVSLTVSNLLIKDATVACSGYAAPIVGYNPNGNTVITLNNVDVNGATVTSDSVAALVGYTTGAVNLTDCDVSGLALTGEQGRPEKVGAYIGTANTASCAVVATNCTNGTTYPDYGRVINGATWNGGIPVSTTAALLNAIKNAPVGETTTIVLANGTYSEDMEITVAALGSSGGDVVIKAGGDNVVIAGKVTLGYRNQGTGNAMYNANVTFDGITFDHAAAATHSLDVQDVKSLTLRDCTIIGDGEYGITSARGNGTGTSLIVGCTFKNAGMQLLGNFATGLVIDDCTFDNSCINVQAGNSVTVQNCNFNATLTDAHVGESFYFVRSNSTPITVKGCKIAIDSTVTGVAASQAKWGMFWNRGTTNWTVENVEITLTAAAQAQTELLVTKLTNTGVINTTALTVNGVTQ